VLIYLDTSVLVAAHTREPHTALAQGWLAGQVADALLVSTWTLVECDSALAIKTRRGELDAPGQAAARADIDALVARLAPVVTATTSDFERARTLCRDSDRGLRAGDALHLAMALGRKATGLATLDTTLARSAEAHGLAAGPADAHGASSRST
jgi:hypothetical protein